MLFFSSRADWSHAVLHYPALFNRYATIVLPAVYGYMDPARPVLQKIKDESVEPLIQKISTNPERLLRIMRHRFDRERLAFLYHRNHPEKQLHDAQYGVIVTPEWFQDINPIAHYRAILSVMREVEPDAPISVNYGEAGVRQYPYEDVDRAIQGDVFTIDDPLNGIVNGVWQIRGNDRIRILGQILAIDTCSKRIASMHNDTITGNPALLVPHACGVGYYDDDMLTTYLFDYAIYRTKLSM